VARPFSQSLPPSRLLAAALLLALPALAQEAPKPEAPKPEAPKQDEPPKQEGEKAPRKKGRKAEKNAAADASPQRWVEKPVAGTTPSELLYSDAAATPEGHRTQFDPIPADIAFEVWLDDVDPRTRTVEKPDPDHPGETLNVKETTVSVISVTNAEWDGYWDYLNALASGDETMFFTVIAGEMVEQKAMLLHYRDEMPSVEQRAKVVADKLRRGVPMKDVVRVHSEDETTRGIDGLSFDHERGQLLYLYPFPKVLFELEEGDIAGPYCNKQATYFLKVDRVTRSANAPWRDRYVASAVVLRFPTGPNLKLNQIGAVKMAARVRTSQERFQRMLPPGLQVPPPPQFGPTDVAPLGTPATPLVRRSVADARDNQLPPEKK
jgi:hypothetical protein